jgi:hypothetical protein
MGMVMRVAGDKEGKGGKAMAMVTKGGGRADSDGNKEGDVDGNKGGGQGRGEWQG